MARPRSISKLGRRSLCHRATAGTSGIQCDKWEEYTHSTTYVVQNKPGVELSLWTIFSSSVGFQICQAERADAKIADLNRTDEASVRKVSHEG